MAANEPDQWRPGPDSRLSVLFDVFALGQQVRTLVATAMAGCGLRPDEFAAYSVVFEARSVTMTELARQLGLPVTTAADFVRAMRDRGHVRRTPHPSDGRAFALSLSAAGLRAHRKASLAFARAHEAFVAGLPPLTEDGCRQTLQQLTATARVAYDAVRAPAIRARPRVRSAGAKHAMRT